MILCLASMYQRAGVLVCSSAGLCLLVPPSFPGSSSFPLKVHYLLSRDCGRVVFPSRSAAATLQEWQSPRSSRHCCQPKSFQMREKIRPKGEQHETRGKWWAKYKGSKFPDLQRKQYSKCQKSLLLNKQSDRFLGDRVWFWDLFGDTSASICFSKTFMAVVTSDVCEIEHALRCI